MSTYAGADHSRQVGGLEVQNPHTKQFQPALPVVSWNKVYESNYNLSNRERLSRELLS